MKTEQGVWVSNLAEGLVLEITKQMSGIILYSMRENPPEHRRMAVVQGLIGGDYPLKVQFFADRALFYRLTQNMLGDHPSEEDIEDYAIEFFNILCGRFLSEIVNQTHISARLMPIRYELPAEETTPETDESMCTLNFVSDKQEQVAFSWTAVPIEEMMRRSKKR